MELRLQHGLPFVSVTVEHGGATLELENVLLDTGSAGTVLKASTMARLGANRMPEDLTYTIRGVGGTEEVIIRTLDRTSIGDASVRRFLAEIATVENGFGIDAILGVDYLRAVGAVIDLGATGHPCGGSLNLLPGQAPPNRRRTLAKHLIRRR